MGVTKVGHTLCLLVLMLSDVLYGTQLLDPTFQFTTEPQDIIVMKKQEVYLNCSASGQSTIRYYWRKNGELLDLSDRRFEILKGTLHIKRVIHRVKTQQSDQGYYECIAETGKHRHAIRSREVHLQIATLPRIEVGESLVTATVGDVVRLECRCRAVPRAQVEWSHNRTKLSHNDTRYTILESGVLLIHQVARRDRGIYQCRVSNRARERHRNYHLRVTRRPRTKPAQLLSRRQSLRPLLGDSIVMECTASGLPRPEVRWIYTNKPLGMFGVPVTDDNRTKINNGILRMSDVQIYDSGIYECVAKQTGKDILSHRADLGVCEPPQLWDVSPHLNESLSNTVRLLCDFRGIPHPTVSWYKDGVPVYFNGRIKNRKTMLGGNLLVITNGDLRDSGFYMCRGENLVGRAQYTIRVTLHAEVNAPGKPRNLVARPWNSTSVRLDWDDTEVRSGQKLVAYSVHYQEQDGTPTIEMSKVAGVSQINLYDLMPYANYSFFVVAYFTTGASPHSDVIYQRTLEDKPIAYPNVEVEPYGPTSMMVSWSRLTPKQAQGVITSHQVQFKKHGNLYFNIEDLPGNQFKYLIRDLEPGMEYDVRVQAGTKLGFPIGQDESPWPWITQKTPNEPNESEVLGLTLAEVDSNKVLLTWKGIQENLVAYNLTIKSDPNKPKSFLLSPKSREYTMSQLKPETQYEVKLSAVYTSGDGPYVVKIIKTPPLSTR